ncbi:NCS2 family permease [Demequina sp. TTPB684]|uniref:NCS2 family permease n=1 Tax=unclassified Demequina TaxID=2620311 RepID=UPI001CF29FE3|nr:MULTISPECIES: NCS2 family permease [unclassified Demequina]MCB2412962.1 NCS2 family permease [Demequina sp. TTPB684]UPU88350.1 NCS2 family permease [Demequina sp. TMPB413]
MATASKESTGFAKKLDNYFSISARGSSFGQEVRGGLTTFLTMVYIVVLNPIILANVPDNTGTYLGGGTEAGSGFVAIAAATALIAGLLTIVMGAWARFPLALAAGLGLNSFVAYGLVGSGMLTWPQAMGLIVIEGALVLLLVLTKLRIKFLHAIPAAIKKAIAAGIGLFLAFIAFWDSKIVRDPGAEFDPTPSEFGQGGYIQSWTMVVFFVGLLVAAILMVRKVKGALLISIVAATVLGFIIEAIRPQQWGLNVPTFDGWSLDALSFDTLFKVDLFGAFTEGSGVGFVSALLLVFSLLVVDFFDTMGTMTAVGEEAGLNDAEGIPANSQEVLIVDSLGAIAGGLGGVSSNTAYIESASGVGDGARTGLASIVTGIAFLVTMLVTPIAQVIPYEAATPVLVIVGLLMLAAAVDIDWKDYRIAVPAFLTMIVMPFSYSIAAGIGVGLIAYVVINAATGKAKAIKPLMWVAAGAFVIYFAIPALKAWFNIS